MSLNRGGSGNRTLVGTIEEIENLLSQINSKEALDILHLLRIKYRDELFELSVKTRNTHDEKIRSIGVPKRAGVYLIVVVNPESNVILYAGKTSGKSDTTGLEFRVRSHVYLLGKTPLTLFIPNWWVKRIYTIKMEDNEEAKRLEKRLWTFLDENVKGKSHFNSLYDLEKKLFKIFKEYTWAPGQIRTIELQPNLNPKTNFVLETPPAGRPRGLFVGE